ncbi:SDR family oxidoreductase [Marinoscillum sp.]|uniref:SDR family oxidoreductase n=1 Tax=Marinoscillum sp. TaxID=2024838 RepID=UPI003BA9912A
MGKLDGKVALITGGNSGIGLATAKLFIEEGAKVVITGRRQEALDEAAAQLGSSVKTILADAGDISTSESVVEQTVAFFGKIDILFLNAGVAYFLPISDITEEHFDQQFNINVKGPFFLIKAALPHLNDGAVIIGNTSVVGSKGFDGTSVYSSTKAAFRSLSRVLASELKSRKIRTVSVAPGPIATPIYDKLGLPEDAVKAMGEGFAGQVPLGRFGSPEELAKSVLFLASDDSSFVNGVELAVDGGLSQI